MSDYWSPWNGFGFLLDKLRFYLRNFQVKKDLDN